MQRTDFEHLSFLPALGFGAVFVLVHFLWAPYLRDCASRSTKQDLPAEVEQAWKERLTSAGDAQQKAVVERARAKVRRLYLERDALGHDTAEAVLAPPTEEPERAAGEGTPPAKGTSGGETLLGRHGVSLLAMTFALLSVLAALLVGGFAIWRMRVNLRMGGYGNLRLVLNLCIALGVAAVVVLAGAKLGPLGFGPTGKPDLWTSEPSGRRLCEAIAAGNLHISLVASQSVESAAQMRATGAIALATGYSASVLLVGAFACALLGCMTHVRSARRGLAMPLPSMLTEIRRRRRELRSILVAAMLLFVMGVVAQSTLRTASIAHVPADRASLVPLLESFAQHETLAIAIIYSTFLALTYYPSAHVLLTAEADLQGALQGTPQASAATSPPEEKPDLLGILRRALLVVAPIVADLFLRLFAAVAE